MGVAVANRGRDDVRIDSFEIIDARGVVAHPALIVGIPRAVGSMAATAGFPPPTARNWPASSVHELRFPIEIRAGSTLAKWGPEVLIRVERRDASSYGYVKGFRVRGTEGKRPFEDVVRTFLGLCWSDEGAAACDDYARQHGYAPASAPSETATTSPSAST